MDKLRGASAVVFKDSKQFKLRQDALGNNNTGKRTKAIFLASCNPQHFLIYEHQELIFASQV